MKKNKILPIKTSDISNNHPKVSVCVVTYNQEKYIRECLQSILDQKTDFEFEILVADDCSTDNTRNIIIELFKKNPCKIKPILHKENIGPYKNIMHVHQAAQGEFIAHVDGDDYLLPGKLQAQADILDKEENCNIVWHRMLIENKSGAISEGPPHKVDNLTALKFDRSNILQFMAIGSNSSKMYRKKLRDFPPPPFDLLDYFANVEQIGDGYAKFASTTAYGVYRSGVGISSSGTHTRRILADCFLYFVKKYPEHRANISAAALTFLLADLKNMRPSWIIFLWPCIKTFHYKSLIYFIRDWKFMRSLVAH